MSYLILRDEYRMVHLPKHHLLISLFLTQINHLNPLVLVKGTELQLFCLHQILTNVPPIIGMLAAKFLFKHFQK